MDFSIPDDMQKVIDRFAVFIHEQVEPLEPQFLNEPFDALCEPLAALRNEARRWGLFGPQIPKEYGGMGLGFMQFAMVSEQLGRSPIGHYAVNCQAPDAGNMEILHRFGTSRQKEQFLLPLARGKVRSCFAMTEPDRAGSNPVWMDTTAVRTDDHWVLNGAKWFTTAADGAAFAVVMAVTDPNADPHERASQIVVPTDTPGFRRVRNISVMGHAGQGWDSHSEIEFEDCRVPLDHMLGEPGSGFSIAQERLGPGRIHHCMRWIGICERAFDLLCQRAATRELAPGDVLGNRQAVQAWIADSRAEIQAARLLVLHAAWKIDREGAKAAREEVSMIKFHVAGVLREVLDRAIQAHGALGMTDQTPLSWFYRNERGARIYDWRDEVHRSVLARRVLRRYGLEVDRTGK